MSNVFKQSTGVTIKMGPFVDETDAKTPETGLSITQADVRLAKNGGDFAQKTENSTASHDENGWYYVSLNTTDTNTLGRLIVAVHKSGALSVHREFMVIASNVWNSFFGSDILHVDVQEWGHEEPLTLLSQMVQVSVQHMDDDVTPGLLLRAEIAVVTDQTHFTLATGSTEDNAYNNLVIVLYDDNNNDYPSTRHVVDYVGSTKTVTINFAPDFTLGADDSVQISAVPKSCTNVVF